MIGKTFLRRPRSYRISSTTAGRLRRKCSVYGLSSTSLVAKNHNRPSCNHGARKIIFRHQAAAAALRSYAHKEESLALGGQAHEIQRAFMVIKRALIPLSVLLGIVAILFIWFGEPDKVSALTREDGVVENLSALFYMVGLCVSFISIFKAERILLPILWAALCLVFLGEETSWFQRIFHYSVPEVERLNAQNEFNLHNLEMFQGGRLTNPTLGLSDFFKSQNLFRLGFFGYFLAIPLMMYIPIFKRLMSRVGYTRPDTGYTLGLLLAFVLSFASALYSPSSVKSALAETREMLYAFFIMLYVIAYIWPTQKIQPPSLVGD